MGTRGYKAYKHKGRHYKFYSSHDSYPSGLGLDIRRSIPDGTDAFHTWLSETRAWLDTIPNCDVGSEDASSPLPSIQDINTGAVIPAAPLFDGISPYAPRTDLTIDFVYVLDLDDLTLFVGGRPLFNLDHLPPEETFLEGIAFDFYGNRACSAALPEEYRSRYYTSTPIPVEEEILLAFDGEVGDQGPTSIHDMLGCRERPTNREEVCINMFQVILGCMMSSQDLHLRSARSVRVSAQFSDSHIDLVEQLIDLATCPIQYGCYSVAQSYRPIRRTDGRWSNSFFWPRKHICVALAAHLDSLPNLKRSAIKLFRHVSTWTDNPPVVYGVLFSITHIVILRICTRTWDVSYSECLEFLPSFYTESRRTAGMISLVRLGDLEADDDVAFYLSIICRLMRAHKFRRTLPLRRSSELDKETNALHRSLPDDVLAVIVEHLDSVWDLHRFALCSRKSMLLALPSLKYPHIAVKSVRRPSRYGFAILSKWLPSTLQPYYIREEGRDHHVACVAEEFGGYAEGESLIVRVHNRTTDPNAQTVSMASLTWEDNTSSMKFAWTAWFADKQK